MDGFGDNTFLFYILSNDQDSSEEANRGLKAATEKWAELISAWGGKI